MTGFYDVGPLGGRCAARERELREAYRLFLEIGACARAEAIANIALVSRSAEAVAIGARVQTQRIAR